MPSLLGFSIGEMRGRGAVGFRLDYAVSVPSAGSVLRTNSHASARQPYLRLCSARKQNSEKNLATSYPPVPTSGDMIQMASEYCPAS